MSIQPLVQAALTLSRPAPSRKVKAQPGGERASTAPDWESTLALAGNGQWLVIWKTETMPCVAFSYHDTLCAAWGHFMRHRDRIWTLVHPRTDVRRTHLQGQIARLQAELEAL